MAVITDEALAALLDEALADIYDEAGSVPAWLFTGPETLIYPSYIDATAQHTLVATPGQAYQIQPAGLGDPVCDADNPVPPPDGLWESD